MSMQNVTIKAPLGVWVCRWRLRRGMSQRRLAALAGLSEDGLKGVEQGRRADPRLSTVVKIADALGITLAELLTEPEPLEY